MSTFLGGDVIQTPGKLCESHHLQVCSASCWQKCAKYKSLQHVYSTPFCEFVHMMPQETHNHHIFHIKYLKSSYDVWEKNPWLKLVATSYLAIICLAAKHPSVHSWKRCWWHFLPQARRNLHLMAVWMFLRFYLAEIHLKQVARQWYICLLPIPG